MPRRRQYPFRLRRDPPPPQSAPNLDLLGGADEKGTPERGTEENVETAKRDAGKEDSLHGGAKKERPTVAADGDTDTMTIGKRKYFIQSIEWMGDICYL